MKTHSRFCRMLLLGAFMLGSASTLEAEDSRRYIRIPSPVPHIAKGLQHVSNFFSRAARRLEGTDEPEYPRSDPSTRPLSAAPRVMTQPSGNIATPPPVAAPQYREIDRYPPPQNNGSRSVAPPSSATTDGGVVSPSVRALSVQRTTPPLTTPAAVVQPKPITSPEQPAPPPRHSFAKPVPGRPGLVYVPGTPETPENMIDVRGLAPGTKVRDPVTRIIFLVP